MVKRKQIALIFSYSEEWIGGTYYILNLIHALKTLEDSLKPNIVIITNTYAEFKKVLNETAYPYLEYRIMRRRYNILEKVINKLSRIIIRKNLINKPIKEEFDCIFPNPKSTAFTDIQSGVDWIPDLQALHMPNYFSETVIKQIQEWQTKLAENCGHIVFSSNDALNDFTSIYPSPNSMLHVMPFAVTHPEYKQLDINKLKSKYDINGDYFFSPNQFWAHKNHIILLKTVNKLKQNGKQITLVLSGKESDKRNPEYFQSLKDYVYKHKLQENIRFLGFIDRSDQLQLMKNALAIIQPSLFEGWSTVVEDAKAMGQFIIASDIKVHKEQLFENCQFFCPHDSNELANIIEERMANSSINQLKSNYEENKKQFAQKFMNIVECVNQNSNRKTGEVYKKCV